MQLSLKLVTHTLVENGVNPLNKFLEEARIPICTLNLKSSQKPEFNYAAQPFLAIQAELTEAFKSMTIDKTDVLLKRIMSEELFLFHFQQ